MYELDSVQFKPYCIVIGYKDTTQMIFLLAGKGTGIAAKSI